MSRASTTCVQVCGHPRVSSRAPNSRARRKTKGEKGEEEAPPGNNRRGRDKWRIDATVIYVDPLPPHPSWTSCWGCVDTSRHLLLAKIRHKPPIATIALYLPSISSLSLFLSLCMHGEDLNFNESRGSSICFLG